MWLVSNIAANSEEDANSIADSTLVVNLLCACRDSAHEIRKEAMWALSNLIYALHDQSKIERIVE